MKIQYQITKNYVSNWGLSHAIREVVSNGLDAEKQLGAKCHVKYNKKGGKLIIRNENTSVRHEDALYFGESSKRGGDYIGQYGEGLKLALLVFARLNIDVTVKNGNHETWRASIQPDKLGVECLTLDVTKADRQENHFDVIIGGVDDDAWETIQSMFLHLRPAAAVRNTSVGQLLDDPEFVGKIYVRGVYVTTRPKFDFGYNFFHVDTGRDRRVPSSFDIDWSIQEMWNELSKRSDPAFQARVFKSFERESAEVEAFAYANPPGLIGALVSEFKKNFGNDAVPVIGSSEGANLEHLGRRPVPLPGRLVKLLRNEMPTPEKITAEFARKVVRRYAMSELPQAEQTNLDMALSLLAETIKDAKSRVTVVDFGADDVSGLHEGSDIYVAKSVVSDFGKLTMILVHEFAHDYGADGAKSHVDAIHKISESVVNQLWRL